MEKNAPIPEEETKASMSHGSVQDGERYKSSLPGHMKRRSTIRYQLVLSKSLVGFGLQSYHDLALSGGHFAFRPTFEKIRLEGFGPAADLTYRAEEVNNVNILLNSTDVTRD